MAEAATAGFRRLMGVDDPMGWTTHGPDGELFVRMAARQTLIDEETLREHSGR